MTKRLIVLIAVAFLATACSSKKTPGGGATSGPPAVPTAPPGATVTVSEMDFSFTPSTLVMTTAQGLSIHNAGPSLHNFSVQGTQVDLDTQAGQSTNTENIGGVLNPGTYQFFCKFHKARGMIGTITVLPG